MASVQCCSSERVLNKVYHRNNCSQFIRNAWFSFRIRRPTGRDLSTNYLSGWIRTWSSESSFSSVIFVLGLTCLSQVYDDYPKLNKVLAAFFEGLRLFRAYYLFLVLMYDHDVDRNNNDLHPQRVGILWFERPLRILCCKSPIHMGRTGSKRFMCPREPRCLSILQRVFSCIDFCIGCQVIVDMIGVREWLAYSFRVRLDFEMKQLTPCQITTPAILKAPRNSNHHGGMKFQATPKLLLLSV